MNDEIKKQLIELFDRAKLFEKQNNMKDALSTYLKALRIYPEYVFALNNAGAIFAQYYSKYTESLECYNRAIRNDPKNIESIIGKGSVMVMLKNTDDAILYYKKALSINGKNTDAMKGLSSAYLQQKKFEIALLVLNNLLEILPEDIEMLCNKGIILAEKEDFNGAEKCFEKALVIAPANPMVIHNKTYLDYLKNKKKDDSSLE